MGQRSLQESPFCLPRKWKQFKADFELDFLHLEYKFFADHSPYGLDIVVIH